jgi:tetratricopeptide (TPR) repeat protein
MHSWLIKSVRLVSGVFFVVLLSACAGTPQTRLISTQPPANLPTQHTLTETAFFPQKAYQCGPAALATVLSSQGVDVHPDELVDKVYIPARKGSLQIEMIATARSYGVMPYKLATELEDILKEVASGRPVLVFQNLAFDWVPRWHYAVVVGYNLTTQQLILRSGTDKRRLISFANFEQTWRRGQYWAYVFVQPGQIPTTAEPLAYTHAASDLFKAGYESEALASFSAAAERWTDLALPHMVLGNTKYAAKDYSAAQQAFSDAIAAEPTNPQAWNNLAYTYVAQQCRVAAIKAIGCAVRLDPDDKNLSDSLKEIVGQQDLKPGECDIPRCPRYQ